MSTGKKSMQLKHDAGGKVKVKIKPNVVGNAVLSDCGLYRPILTRDWSNRAPSPVILWIGMNPSTALETIDDPTVIREQNFSDQWGFKRYVKCNVMDYRSTDQKQLLRTDINVCCNMNLATIIYSAKRAQRVMMAHGTLKPQIAAYGDIVAYVLDALDIPMHVLKISSNGSPYHPLYMAGDTEPFEYKPRGLSPKEMKKMKEVYPLTKLFENLSPDHVDQKDIDTIITYVSKKYESFS